MGIRLMDEIVNLLEDESNGAGAALYRHDSYDIVNAALDGTALQVPNTLRRQEYRAFPVPSSKRANDERIAAVSSYKLAAHLAGLGWVGKS